jgi:hypothetical protein
MSPYEKLYDAEPKEVDAEEERARMFIAAV